MPCHPVLISVSLASSDINYTTARVYVAGTMDKVDDDRTRWLEMSPEQYNALAETAYLLQSPANAERLIKSISNLRAGKTQSRQLIEE